MAERLIGSSALVTGGGSGIGAATAAAMAGEGAAVAVLDIDPGAAARTAARIEECGGRAVGIACDVADPPEVSEAFDAATRAFGVPTAVFNNAGITGPMMPLPEVTVEDFDRCVAVNLRGVFLVAREFVRRSLDAGLRGAMVCTASIDALYAEPYCAAYCATKGGVISMTRAMALDYAAAGLQINCICPGYVESGMTTPLWEEVRGSRQEAAGKHAIGRVADPAEIAAAVVFLCSEDASFVTGHPLVVDGGMSIGGRLLAESSLYGSGSTGGTY